MLALSTAMPVFGTRTVPVRARIGLAFFFASAAQAGLPPVSEIIARVAPQVSIFGLASR